MNELQKDETAWAAMSEGKRKLGNLVAVHWPIWQPWWGPSAWQQNADTNLHNSTHLLNAEPIGAIPLMMRAAYEYSWVDSGLCVEFCSCRLAMVSYPSLAAVSWLTYEILDQFQAIYCGVGLAVHTLEHLMLTLLTLLLAVASKSNVMNDWVPLR